MKVDANSKRGGIPGDLRLLHLYPLVVIRKIDLRDEKLTRNDITRLGSVTELTHL